MQYSKRAALLIGLASLSACGGGGQSPEEERRARQEELRIQAVAKEAEARALGSDTPCEANNQCAYLLFSDEKELCDSEYTQEDLKIYSKIAPTVFQAEQASLAQRALVSEVRRIQDPPVACLAVIYTPPPPPVCIANRCVEAFPVQ